jgi:cathepsin C
MRLAVYKNGPVEVAFEVYDDFFNYAGGIYHHTFLRDKSNFGFSPFELTNHAVLVVGYGVDKESGEKYWIVKNR